MKLVELLARELSEWPEKASHAVQHENGGVGFTYDGKPGRDEDHSDWSIDALTASRNAYWLIGAATNISTTASDHATAIVTRFDWSAERARIAKPAKNAEGWIRHRGGKCPVDDDAIVDVRLRDGTLWINGGAERGSYWTWEHSINFSDIMAYRLHKPAEQSVNMEALSATADAFGDSHADVMESVLSRLDGPLQWRDRIAEIDVEVQARTAERAELVQKLASEGFALIGRVVDSAVCQPDPVRWMIGDSVECVSSSYSFITVGTIYKITGLERNMVQFLDDDGTEMEYERAHFKFHSRPSA